MEFEKDGADIKKQIKGNEVVITAEKPKATAKAKATTNSKCLYCNWIFH